MKKQCQKTNGILKKAGIIFLSITAMLILCSCGGSEDTETNTAIKMITEVKNGYLGHYDTVTINDVFSFSYEDGEWNGGQAVAGEYYIVEFSDEDVKIQFQVYEGAETFNVSGFEIPWEDETYEDYEVKMFLDALYKLYAFEHPEYELVIDESTSNNTLEGHFGPVKSVEESEYAGAALTETETASAQETEEEYIDDLELSVCSAYEGNFIYEEGNSYYCTANVFSMRYGYWINAAPFDYDGNEIIFFEGYLEENDNGSYSVYNEDYATSADVVFTEDGLYITILDTDYADMWKLNAYYELYDLDLSDSFDYGDEYEADDIDDYLCTLYNIDGGDDIVSLYTDGNGNLCVWYGSCDGDFEYYSRIYNSYLIGNDTLYGYYNAEDADEFIFMDGGYVDVLLSGYGSTHYQEYQKEEYYFSY